jgi:hypothetical protein
VEALYVKAKLPMLVPVEECSFSSTFFFICISCSLKPGLTTRAMNIPNNAAPIAFTDAVGRTFHLPFPFVSNLGCKYSI